MVNIKQNKHFTVRCSSPQEVVEVARYIIESTDTECSEEQYSLLKSYLKENVFDDNRKILHVSTMYLESSSNPNVDVEKPVLMNYTPAPAQMKIKVYSFSQWKKLIARQRNRVDVNASN